MNDEPKEVRHAHVYVEETSLDAAAIQMAVDALFTRLPAAGRLGPQSRVLIKPNLLRKNAPEKAVTTHPAVLKAVLLYLRGRGVTQVTVADSPGGPYTAAGMRAVYHQCGYEDAAAETGALLYTECQSAPVKTQGEMVREFNLIRPALDCDFIINLPKLKTHVLTGISGAVKNLFGCVPGLQKAEFHMRFPDRGHFSSMLVDLCETIKADIHLVDGILGMEGDGPGGGTPRACNLLLAGEDPYLVDLALCHYMGMDAMDTPVLEAAARRGFCPRQLEDGVLVGTEAATRPFNGFVPPRSYSGKLDFRSSLPGFLQPLMEPVSRKLAPHPVVQKKQCIGCMKCAEICPQKVISQKNGKAVIQDKGCIRCFCCHEVCPAKAIDIRQFGLFNR